jgi:hypothetical protein
LHKAQVRFLKPGWMIALIGYNNQLDRYGIQFIEVMSSSVLASVIDYRQTITGGTGIAGLGSD